MREEFIIATGQVFEPFIVTLKEQEIWGGAMGMDATYRQNIKWEQVEDEILRNLKFVSWTNEGNSANRCWEEITQEVVGKPGDYSDLEAQ